MKSKGMKKDSLGKCQIRCTALPQSLGFQIEINQKQKIRMSLSALKQHNQNPKRPKLLKNAEKVTNKKNQK